MDQGIRGPSFAALKRRGDTRAWLFYFRKERAQTLPGHFGAFERDFKRVPKGKQIEGETNKCKGGGGR